MIKYYTDDCGAVRAIDDDQAFLVQETWRKITEAEALAAVASSSAITPDSEQTWVVSELSSADVEINKHDDGDARATSTVAAWRAYRCQLRDYVKGGQIVGERPVRPI